MEQVEGKLNTLLSIAEECVEVSELKALIVSGAPMVFYDGFEPSGRMHIAQGLLRAINVNKITSIGGKFIFYVADWFALMNLKLGGDLEKIRNAGRLMIEIWKASGMKMENVQFIWASEEIATRSADYWHLVLDIATKFNITRVKKCTPIMGRDIPQQEQDEKQTKDPVDELPMSVLLYAVMQCADIPFLKVNVASLGIDQRKVLMMNREYAAKLKQKHPPIALMHHMLLGLNGQKMSKSDPENAIFMDDQEADVNRKLKKALCEPGKVSPNPILEYVKYIIFEKDASLTVERSDKNGGNITFNSYGELEKAFVDGLLHPGDLKPTVAKIINGYLSSVRQALDSNPESKELVKKVASYKITK